MLKARRVGDLVGRELDWWLFAALFRNLRRANRLLVARGTSGKPGCPFAAPPGSLKRGASGTVSPRLGALARVRVKALGFRWQLRGSP